MRAVCIDPDAGRVWVADEELNFTVIREQDGSWRRGIPSADETMNDFEDVRDAQKAESIFQEAAKAVEKNPALRRIQKS